MLTNKGIYDVAAVCSDEERGFFKACGFGDDLLKSTTMMYTRSESDPSSLTSNQTVKSAGRKLLIVPPSKEPFQL